MGKGDRKTAKGKRSIASYGNVRSHVAAKATGAASAPVARKTATKATTKVIAKAPAKKVVTRKSASK